MSWNRIKNLSRKVMEIQPVVVIAPPLKIILMLRILSKLFQY